jgi:hypothetical protein
MVVRLLQRYAHYLKPTKPKFTSVFVAVRFKALLLSAFKVDLSSFGDPSAACSLKEKKSASLHFCSQRHI